MIGTVRDAFSANQLFVALQPIVDFEKREVFGYEALARCKSATFREALDLIKAALVTQRMGELGRELRRWPSGRVPAADSS